MDTRPKVLSIDDNVTNQKLVEDVLSSEYEVKTVMSSTSGIEALHSFKPDVILLDVDMPNLDGFRVCRMIRSEPSFALTPILFVSGYAQEHHLKGYQVGGDDYIDIPVDIHSLKNKLALNLERFKARHAQELASNDLPALDQNIQYLHEYLLTLISLPNLDALGDLILDSLGKIGLQGALYRHPDGQIHSSIGPLTDLETILLQQATQTYPMDHSARFIWGSKNLAAIIQNMPNPRNAQHLALRQILVTLFSAADRKIKQFKEESATRTASYHEVDFSRPGTPPTATELDIDSINVHGYKLEYSLELLESQSEDNLSSICQTLQALVNQSTEPHEHRKLSKLLQQCMATRLAIYDHCLEAQTQYHEIMRCISSPKETS